MKKLMAAYKHYLEENSSQNTTLSYMRDIVKFLDDNDITAKKQLLKIKEDTINEYVQKLKSRNMAYSSISRAIAALKKFFVYCENEGIIKANPAEKIEVPRTQRKLPDTMSDEDVIKLLEAPDEKTIKGIRDRAMLEFMYATGARVSELINLKMGDISLKNEMVVLITGEKRRLVPLGKVAIEALYNYVNNCRANLVTAQSGDAFFVNFYGQPLTRQGFWKIVKGYIEACELNRNIAPQTLRHSFALHMLRNGADTHSVSEMLGYSDVSSTKIYLEVMNNKIKEVYKNAHPRA